MTFPAVLHLMLTKPDWIDSLCNNISDRLLITWGLQIFASQVQKRVDDLPSVICRVEDRGLLRKFELAHGGSTTECLPRHSVSQTSPSSKSRFFDEDYVALASPGRLVVAGDTSRHQAARNAAARLWRVSMGICDGIHHCSIEGEARARAPLALWGQAVTSVCRSAFPKFLRG